MSDDNHKKSDLKRYAWRLVGGGFKDRLYGQLGGSAGGMNAY